MRWQRGVVRDCSIVKNGDGPKADKDGGMTPTTVEDLSAGARSYATYADWFEVAYAQGRLNHLATQTFADCGIDLFRHMQEEAFGDPATPSFVMSIVTAGTSREIEVDFGYGCTRGGPPGTIFLGPPDAPLPYRG